MTDAMIVITLFSAAFMVWSGISMHTKNLRSALVFKFIPTVCGLGNLWVGLQLGGWI